MVNTPLSHFNIDRSRFESKTEQLKMLELLRSLHRDLQELDDKSPNYRYDASEVAFLTSLHVLDLLRQLLGILDGTYPEALQDPDFSQLDNLVQALNSRQGYIVDWARLAGFSVENPQNESWTSL